jgi:hypothetical protein
MGNVTFQLKKPEKRSKKSLIYLQFYYNGGKKLVFSFGQNIDPANWSKSKQRVKSNTQTTADGQYALNDLLDNLEKECYRAYYDALKNGVPETHVIRQHLKKLYFKESPSNANGLFDLISRFVSGEMKHEGRNKSPNTLKTYKTTENYLKEFEKNSKQPVTYDSINLGFYNSFVAFLVEKKGLNPNSVGKEIKNIKTFLSAANDYGYTTNSIHTNKKFKKVQVDTDSVYLTDAEIMHLFRYDLTADKRLEKVRDLFVFGCSVRLRFSDFSTLRLENIRTIEGDKFISKVTQKQVNWFGSLAIRSFLKSSPNTRRTPIVFRQLRQIKNSTII